MKNQSKLPRLTLCLLSSAVALSAVGLPSFAQQKSGGTGLDALDENRTREALATSGFEDLLERSFETGKVPQNERDDIKALIAINQLLNQNPDKLNARQRREMVAKVTKGLDKVLKNMKDPRALSNLGGRLYALGVANNVTLIEYWGEDTATQATMKDAAEAVVKTYAKAEVEIGVQVGDLANKIKTPDQVELMKQLDKMQATQTTIMYTKVSSQYAVALSLDKASPDRKKIADESIEALKPFDDPTTGIQPTIKVQIGKFLIAKSDFEGAKTMFKSLYEDKGNVQPSPKPFDLNDARFFTAVADLLAGKPDDADKQLKETITWQEANFTVPADKQLVHDTSEVLKARIAWFRAEKAANEADKAKFNDQASAILTALMKSNPGLKPLILEQLVTRLPAGADLKKLDTLLLQSLIERAKTEYAKDAKEKFDKPTVEKGVAAAKEILARKGQAGVDKDAVEAALLVLPFFAQKLEQPKVAAGGFLDFAEAKIKDDPKKATDAWEQAMGIIVGDFKAPNTTDLEVTALYDRAVPMGINAPINRKDLAYAWGRRLQSKVPLDEKNAVAINNDAIKYLKLVPADSPVSLNAKYWLSIALSTKLDKDTKISAGDKQAVLKEIQTTSEQIAKSAKEEIEKTPDEAKKNTYRQMLVRTPLLAAGLAQTQQKDSKLALKILENYEDTVKGLKNADLLLSDALQTRVMAYMDLGENLKATDALVNLIEKQGANQGMAMVAQLLQRLNKEIDNAQIKGDKATVAKLAPTRAVLTGFLAKWAADNKDPKVKELAFGYQAFDADSKRLAASLETDLAKKKALLDETLKAYEVLLALPKGAADPNILFGSAITYYELGNYDKAQEILGKLLKARQLGQPIMEVMVNGQPELQPNDLYWEARFKFLRANVEIAKRPPGNAELMKSLAGELRIIYTQFGKTTGGNKWVKDFDKLRLELDPTIIPDETVAPATSQPTQPVEP